MSTFVPLDLPESTGRGFDCAIKSHDRIALITRADPPAMPNRSRKPRLVKGRALPLSEVFKVMTPPYVCGWCDLPTDAELELHRARIAADRRQLSEGRRSQLRPQRGEERVVEEIQHVRSHRDGSSSHFLSLLNAEVDVALSGCPEIGERAWRIAERECRRGSERRRVDPVVQAIIQ